MLARLFNKFRSWAPAHRAMTIDFPTTDELSKRQRESSDKDSISDGLIVAFYTENTLYELEKDRLLRSAERLQLRILAKATATTGSWVRNAGLKPGFLLDQRKLQRGPLLYVDVDAVFHRNPWPQLQSMDCDIAVYYEANGRLLSGTILLNDTEQMATLLERWAARCRDNPDMWDQLALEQILMEDAASAQPLFRIARLSVSYCWIFDHLDNEPVDTVYVEHLQASREATKRQRLFGRTGKRLTRRRDRVAVIDAILSQYDQAKDK